MKALALPLGGEWGVSPPITRTTLPVGVEEKARRRGEGAALAAADLPRGVVLDLGGAHRQNVAALPRGVHVVGD